MFGVLCIYNVVQLFGNPPCFFLSTAFARKAQAELISIPPRSKFGPIYLPASFFQGVHSNKQNKQAKPLPLLFGVLGIYNFVQLFGNPPCFFLCTAFARKARAELVSIQSRSKFGPIYLPASFFQGVHSNKQNKQAKPLPLLFGVLGIYNFVQLFGNPPCFFLSTAFARKARAELVSIQPRSIFPFRKTKIESRTDLSRKAILCVIE